MDPVGDVHPEVKVEGDRFSLYFYNNAAEEDFTNHPYYRVVYSSTGELISPRQRISEAPQRFSAAWDEEALPRGNKTADFKVDTNGHFFESTNRQSGQTNRRRLMWPNGKMVFQNFHDWAVSETHLVLLGTIETPKFGNNGFPATDLALASFEIDAGNPPVMTVLGRVPTIYEFPRCSNLIVNDFGFHVAWMCDGSGEFGEKLKPYTFNLTSWDPAVRKRKTQDLKADYRWNTSISIASIDDRLCIAWHDGRIYSRFKISKIRTLFISLKNL